MTDKMADGNDGMPELDDISQLGKKVRKCFATWKKSNKTFCNLEKKVTKLIGTLKKGNKTFHNKKVSKQECEF